MNCTLIHDRAYLDACSAWDNAYRDTAMDLGDKEEIVERCCDVIEERMVAHGSHDVPRSPLAFCYGQSCDGWGLHEWERYSPPQGAWGQGYRYGCRRCNCEASWRGSALRRPHPMTKTF
jgi:hypothetical protein